MALPVKRFVISSACGGAIALLFAVTVPDIGWLLGPVFGAASAFICHDLLKRREFELDWRRRQARFE